MRRVAKLMHTAAAAYAKQEEICVFNLVTIAQEQLQVRRGRDGNEALLRYPRKTEMIWVSAMYVFRN